MTVKKLFEQTYIYQQMILNTGESEQRWLDVLDVLDFLLPARQPYCAHNS